MEIRRPEDSGRMGIQDKGQEADRHNNLGSDQTPDSLRLHLSAYQEGVAQRL